MSEKNGRLTVKRLQDDKDLRKELGITQEDVDMALLNAKRYEKTDAAVENAVLKAIWNNPRVQDELSKKDRSVLGDYLKMFPAEFDNIEPLSAKSVLKAAGYTVPKDTKEAEQKLLDEYNKGVAEQNTLRNRVRMDPSMGDIGADNLDALVYTIAERKERQGKKQGKLAHFFMPRVAEAAEMGRDVEAKDVIGDALENVAMAVPMSMAYKGIKAGNVLAGLGKSALASSTVPLATEVMDAAIYDENSNPDRADFNPYDVAIGTTTNAVAPYTLNRLFGRMGRFFVDKGSEAAAKGKVALKSILDDEFRKAYGGLASGSPYDVYAKALSDDAVNESVKKQAWKISKAIDVVAPWLESYGVNKYGREKDANLGLTLLGMPLSNVLDEPLPKLVQDMRQEKAEEAYDRARENKAREVLKPYYLSMDDSLTPEDREWLEKLAINPGLVNGEGEGSGTSFRNWYMTRGARILGRDDLFGNAYVTGDTGK